MLLAVLDRHMPADTTTDLNTDSDNKWHPGIPFRTATERQTELRNGIKRHRSHASWIQTTLDKPFVPEAIHPYLAAYFTDLGYQLDDFISLDKRNFDTRVEPGATALIKFGNTMKSGETDLFARGIIKTDASAKNDDLIVTIEGVDVDIKGWQIRGILRDNADTHARYEHRASQYLATRDE